MLIDICIITSRIRRSLYTEQYIAYTIQITWPSRREPASDSTLSKHSTTCVHSMHPRVQHFKLLPSCSPSHSQVASIFRCLDINRHLSVSWKCCTMCLHARNRFRNHFFNIPFVGTIPPSLRNGNSSPPGTAGLEAVHFFAADSQIVGLQIPCPEPFVKLCFLPPVNHVRAKGLALVCKFILFFLLPPTLSLLTVAKPHQCSHVSLESCVALNYL